MHVLARRLLGASAGASLLAAPLAAQSTTPQDSAARADSAQRADSLARRRKVQALEAVRVTATKTPTPLRDVPQAVTVVSSALIADQAMQGMADVVRYVPGVTMSQGEGNRDQPTIRGNATTADFFVDGVRDDVQFVRDLYNVERVEALKGSNAMIFGRGGGGGVINRVTKEARWSPLRELTLQGGSYDNKRLSADVGQGITTSLAARLNGTYENSGLFRDGVRVRRYGVNPTLTFAPGSRATSLALGFEHFRDHRTADRGLPSFEGRPFAGAHRSTFFGDPDASYADARVNAAWATLAHERASGLAVRNRLRVASYDKFYQNVYPSGAVNDAGTSVSIGAYNNATRRRNLIDQTDVTYGVWTGPLRHTLLVGAELGRQVTDNRRLTGYFGGNATSFAAPVSDPTISAPVSFRPSATDADTHVVADVGALYAQDQVALSASWQLIAGLRYERFDLRYHDDRTGADLRRRDAMPSPRAGLLFKPVEPLSFYGGYSRSYLPSAGDQFSSLTDVTKGLEPERFDNYEIGAKWDVADRLALTSAVYRLDRTNTRAVDPLDPTRTVQTGAQRTTGFELGVSGSLAPRWEIAGGYTSQRATITSTTSAAAAGATVPLVPHHTLSLWNRVQLARALGAGLGVVHRADMYAAIDDRVTLPAYTEVDAALFVTLARNLRAQLNVENLLGASYYTTASGNNNITPGSPRVARVSITTGF
jgi:catecholate siderophore receptor